MGLQHLKCCCMPVFRQQNPIYISVLTPAFCPPTLSGTALRSLQGSSDIYSCLATENRTQVSKHRDLISFKILWDIWNIYGKDRCDMGSMGILQLFRTADRCHSQNLKAPQKCHSIPFFWDLPFRTLKSVNLISRFYLLHCAVLHQTNQYISY